MLWSLGSSLVSAEPAKGIWDDHGTHAKSGVEGDLKDPDLTDGKSGVKPPPQNYFIPPQRQFADVDLEELEENKNQDYSPYALVQFTYSIKYRGKSLPKGYYQIKVGGAYDGSLTHHLEERPPQDPTVRRRRKEKEPLRVLVLKQLGKVIAVLPIEEQEPYTRPNKEAPKAFKRPVAKLILAPQQPVLKVFWDKTIYTTGLEY